MRSGYHAYGRKVIYEGAPDVKSAGQVIRPAPLRPQGRGGLAAEPPVSAAFATGQAKPAHEWAVKMGVDLDLSIARHPFFSSGSGRAIGWYRRQQDGAVIIANGDQFNGNFGIPVVMRPDLDKDYEADSIVQVIWRQFRQVLRRAQRVLVLGHSLTDEALVGALVDEVTPTERIAITLLGKSDDPDGVADSATSTMVVANQRLPGAPSIPLRFDKDLQPPEIHIKKWDALLQGAVNATP